MLHTRDEGKWQRLCSPLRVKIKVDRVRCFNQLVNEAFERRSNDQLPGYHTKATKSQQCPTIEADGQMCVSNYATLPSLQSITTTDVLNHLSSTAWNHLDRGFSFKSPKIANNSQRIVDYNYTLDYTILGIHCGYIYCAKLSAINDWKSEDKLIVQSGKTLEIKYSRMRWNA